MTNYLYVIMKCQFKTTCVLATKINKSFGDINPDSKKSFFILKEMPDDLWNKYALNSPSTRSTYYELT